MVGSGPIDLYIPRPVISRQAERTGGVKAKTQNKSGIASRSRKTIAKTKMIWIKWIRLRCPRTWLKTCAYLNRETIKMATASVTIGNTRWITGISHSATRWPEPPGDQRLLTQLLQRDRKRGDGRGRRR